MLGCGFLERVYENALAYELRQTGPAVCQQAGVAVRYHQDIVVGQYIADLFIEQSVAVELKAVWTMDKVHRAQCKRPPSQQLAPVPAAGLRPAETGDPSFGLAATRQAPLSGVPRIICVHGRSFGVSCTATAAPSQPPVRSASRRGGCLRSRSDHPHDSRKTHNFAWPRPCQWWCRWFWRRAA